MSPRLVSGLVAVAAVLVAAGGAVGYARSGSVPSLVAGVLAGLLWIACAVGIARGSPGWGTSAAAIGIGLAATMAWRWVATGSPMPALPVIALSLAVVVVVLTARRLDAQPP